MITLWVKTCQVIFNITLCIFSLNVYWMKPRVMKEYSEEYMDTSSCNQIFEYMFLHADNTAIHLKVYRLIQFQKCTIYPAVKCYLIYEIVNCIYENVKLLFLATSLLTVIEWYSDMVIINLKKLHDVKRAASSTLLTCTTIRIQRGYCSTHNTTLWILHIIIMWENETRHCLNAFDFAKHLPLYKIYLGSFKKSYSSRFHMS